MKSLVRIFFVAIVITMPARASGEADLSESNLWRQYEQERMAMEFFDAMYQKWDVLAFRNLCRSEKRQKKALESLIMEHGDTEMIKEMKPGVYSHNELNLLYTKLLSKGNESLIGALESGAYVEEKSIDDLISLVSSVENGHLAFELSNLLADSRCHLFVMVCELKNRDVEYRPKILTIDNYLKSIESMSARPDGKLPDCPFSKEDCPFKKMSN